MSQAPVAVPFLLLGETRRRVLTEHVRAAAQRWRRGWAGERQPQLTVQVHDSYRSSPAFWWADTALATFCPEAATELAVLWEMRSLPALAGFTHAGTDLLDSALSRSALVAELATQAMRSLVSELLPGPAQDAPPPPGSVTVTQTREGGSDAVREIAAERMPCVLITLEEVRAALLVMLSPQLLAQILPANTSYVPSETLERRLTAVEDEQLTVQQVLGHAYISLAELARLRVGDVLVLEEPLSKGGELLLAGPAAGAIPIGATLPGSVGARRAVQIHMITNKERSK